MQEIAITDFLRKGFYSKTFPDFSHQTVFVAQQVVKQDKEIEIHNNGVSLPFL